MKVKAASTQTLVNTAMYIIYEELGLKQNLLLQQLTDHYSLKISQAHFSKAYTLFLKDKVLYQKKSVLSKATMENLFDVLKNYLQKAQNIQFLNQEEAIFADKSRKWGAIKGVFIQDEIVEEENELIRTHDKLDLYRKTELFENSKSIDILGTYFTSLTVLLEQLAIAIEKNDCIVRILMLDPHQDVIRQRAKSLSNIAGENLVEIAVIQAERLREFAREYPQHVEFYLYNALPGFSLFRFDNVMFVGYQWFNRMARDGAYQEYRLGLPHPSPFIRQIQEHWKNLWNHAKYWKDINQYSCKFTCYIEKDHEIKSMDLMINPHSNDAVLLDASSKLRYYGTLNNLGSNLAIIHMQGENALWTISLFFNAALDKYNLQELVTGIYTVNSLEDCEIVSRRFVLVKETAKKHHFSTEERNEILRSYLSTMKTIHVANWQSLKSYLQGRVN